MFSGPHSSQQVQHLRLIHPFSSASLLKPMEVRLDLVRWHTRPPCAVRAFRLFDGLDIGGIEGREVRHGAALFIADFDGFSGLQSDPRLFGC